MRLFRSILFGILLGAAIFFVPFHFPFFLLFFFLFFFGRFFFSPWRRRWHGWRHDGWNYYNDTIPIDGYGNNSARQPQGPEQKINIQ